MNATLADISAQTGLSEAALSVLQVALMRGGYTQAQFNHPELGGMGQWMRGGMILIGDMFNTALAAKISLACTLLSDQGLRANSSTGMGGIAGFSTPASWWPASYDRPSMAAAQNELEYAYFPGMGRFAVRLGSKITFYDVSHLVVTGVGNQSGEILLYTTSGNRRLSELPQVIQ